MLMVHILKALLDQAHKNCNDAHYFFRSFLSSDIYVVPSQRVNGKNKWGNFVHQRQRRSLIVAN